MTQNNKKETFPKRFLDMKFDFEISCRHAARQLKRLNGSVMVWLH